MSAASAAPPDWTQLANEALDLWQQHLASLAADPTAKAELPPLMTPFLPGGQLFAEWQAAMQKSWHGSAAATTTNPFAAGTAAPAAGAGAAAAQPAAAAGFDLLAQLAGRMASFEQRLAELEARLAGANAAAAAKPRPRRRAATDGGDPGSNSGGGA